MWRPNDWDGEDLLETLKAERLSLFSTKEPDMTDLEIFEAGTDAMLKALGKTPSHGVYTGALFEGGGKKFRCLFVPDDD